MKNKKGKIEENKEEDTSNQNSDENTNVDENNNDTGSEEMNKYNELNDRFLRLYAEFDNYRKRSNKEKIDLISSANAGLLKDLLPILDDFERGINNNL